MANRVRARVESRKIAPQAEMEALTVEAILNRDAQTGPHRNEASSGRPRQ